MILHLTPDPVADPRIIGFWEGINGDYKLTNEYREDGTFVQHVGERSSDTRRYRIEGDEFISLIEQRDRSIHEQRTKYSISGDQLTFYYGKTEMRFRRVEKR